MPIIAIIGPSGAGKSTLVDMYLAEHPDAILHKSVTTRPIRGRDDTSHTFVTDVEFDALEQQGKLLQSVSAYGYRYALPKLPKDITKTIFVLIRAEFVPPFLKLYPAARIVQIEAPLDVLARRLAERGDTTRIDTTALLAETELGRRNADAIISTTSSPAMSYTEFKETL